MKKKVLSILTVLFPVIGTFGAPPLIAFERNNAVLIANLDGTGVKKIADGIFPAISLDGTQVAFNTVEKTSDTTYIRHIAVVDVAAGKTTVFKDVPSDSSYYPTWSPDGKRILFTLRQNEVWDLGLINPDGTDFRVLKKGAPNEVTRLTFRLTPLDWRSTQTRTQRRGPAPNVTLPSPSSRAAKSQSSKTSQATTALARSGRRTDRNSRSLSWQRRNGGSAWSTPTAQVFGS